MADSDSAPQPWENVIPWEQQRRQLHMDLPQLLPPLSTAPQTSAPGPTPSAAPLSEAAPTPRLGLAPTQPKPLAEEGDPYGDVKAMSDIQAARSKLQGEPVVNQVGTGHKILGTILRLANNPGMQQMGYEMTHPGDVQRAQKLDELTEQEKLVSERSRIREESSRARKALEPPEEKGAKDVKELITRAAADAMKRGQDPNEDPRVKQLQKLDPEKFEHETYADLGAKAAREAVARGEDPRKSELVKEYNELAAGQQKPTKPETKQGIWTHTDKSGKTVTENAFGVEGETGKGFTNVDTGEVMHGFKPFAPFSQTPNYQFLMGTTPEGGQVPIRANVRSGDVEEVKPTKAGITAIPKPAQAAIDKETKAARDADSRYKKMQDNERDAFNKDGTVNQQAMLSLVANHIGMTLGQQKGARINQAVWNEAIKSAPWLQSLEATFSADGILSGVKLTRPQARQMVELGKQAREIAWQQAQDTAKGYGVPTAVRLPKDLEQPAAAPNAPPPGAKVMSPEEFLKGTP